MKPCISKILFNPIEIPGFIYFLCIFAIILSFHAKGKYIRHLFPERLNKLLGTIQITDSIKISDCEPLDWQFRRSQKNLSEGNAIKSQQPKSLL